MLVVNIKPICRSAFFIFLLVISGCDKNGTLDRGYLEGKISIGPLCPVETDPPNPACQPTAETYKAYPVSIWTINANRKISQITPALDGSYRIALDPGNYLIKLDSEQNTIGVSNLPLDVYISSKEETILNINIDTGIR